MLDQYKRMQRKSMMLAQKYMRLEQQKAELLRELEEITKQEVEAR